MHEHPCPIVVDLQIWLSSADRLHTFVSCDSLLLVGCIVVHCARSKIALDSFVPRKAAMTLKELQKLQQYLD
jgi:hypothetical protein